MSFLKAQVLVHKERNSRRYLSINYPSSIYQSSLSIIFKQATFELTSVLSLTAPLTCDADACIPDTPDLRTGHKTARLGGGEEVWTSRIPIPDSHRAGLENQKLLSFGQILPSSSFPPFPPPFLPPPSLFPFVPSFYRIWQIFWLFKRDLFYLKKHFKMNTGLTSQTTWGILPIVLWDHAIGCVVSIPHSCWDRDPGDRNRPLGPVFFPPPLPFLPASFNEINLY